MTRPIFSTHVVSVLAACLSISACANISGLGGSSEYGCKAPQGVRCESVSGNYYNAIKNNLPAQRERRETNAAPRTMATHAESAVAAKAPTLGKTTTDTAAPLRAQARVLRLWFKPWEDADRDLYDQGFVYVQIDNGRWLIDHMQQRIRDAYAPILPPRSSALPSATPTKPADPRLSGSGTPGGSSGPSAAAPKSLPGTANLPDNDGQ
jgi:conjugal transfer pilus assembly protein TraV